MTISKSIMFINLSNPLYNTVIVFISIMALIYIIKPEAIYDRENREFRQFGTDDGKTLMPIYVIAILIAIILYVLFNQIAKIMNPIQPDSDLTLSNRIYTEKESDMSSLRNQMVLMNQNIAQLNQMNQLNQMSHINQINQQLANLQMSQMPAGKSDRPVRSSRPRRSEYIRGYDTSGIYRNRSVSSDGSNGSDRSIMSNRSMKSIDADNIVNSVLVSTRPSVTHTNSYTYSNRSNGINESNRAILPNNYSI
jgi:TolA-binding protein